MVNDKSVAWGQTVTVNCYSQNSWAFQSLVYCPGTPHPHPLPQGERERNRPSREDVLFPRPLRERVRVRGSPKLAGQCIQQVYSLWSNVYGLTSPCSKLPIHVRSINSATSILACFRMCDRVERLTGRCAGTVNLRVS